MKKQLVLVSALAALFSVSSANALIIDDFSIDQLEIRLTGKSSDSRLVSGPETSILGGWRHTYVEMYAGSGSDQTTVRIVNDPREALDIANGVGASSKTVLTWNANDSLLGLGNLNLWDLGPGGIFTAFPTRNDHRLDLLFEVKDYETGLTAVLLREFKAGSVGATDVDFFFSFDKFSNPLALASADSIRMTIDSLTPGLDANIDFVATLDVPPGVVPEPATLGLLGLGLLGLGLSRLKAKTRKA